MSDPTDTVDLARMVAVETSPTDSVGLTARRLAWALIVAHDKLEQRRVTDLSLIVAHDELEQRRATDLSRAEAEALRGCSVHCQDKSQLALATAAINKAVSRVFKCLRCWDAGVLKVFTSGGEPYAAQFCSCPAGEARRT